MNTITVGLLFCPFWLTGVTISGTRDDVPEKTILQFIKEPPSVKELAFKWDGKKGNFQGVVYGTIAYHSSGCFFARYAGDWSEFSNSFVYPKTQMYAQTQTGCWHFGSPDAGSRSDSLMELVLTPSPRSAGSIRTGISNSVAFGSSVAFYSLCYGIPRLKNVSIDESSGSFSGRPWISLFGERVSGHVSVSPDLLSVEVNYLAKYTASTGYFSVSCSFPVPIADRDAIPSDIKIRRAMREHDEKELITDIQIERVIPGAPDLRDFDSTRHHLLGMGNHIIVADTERTEEIKIDPEVQAAFAALPKGPPAGELLSSAEAEASSAGKVVFVDFGASWCGPCKRLDAFLARPEINALFDKYFVSLKVVVDETIANKALENRGADHLYHALGGVAGIPFIAFLTPQGRLIVNSKTAEGGTSAFPDDAQGITVFLDTLRKAAPAMSSMELEKVRGTLLKYTP